MSDIDTPAVVERGRDERVQGPTTPTGKFLDEEYDERAETWHIVAVEREAAEQERERILNEMRDALNVMPGLAPWRAASRVAVRGIITLVKDMPKEDE